MRYTFMYVSPTLPLTGGPGPFYYLAYLHAKTGSPQAVTGKEGSARGLGMLAPLMPPRLCHNVSAASYIQEKRWDSVGLSSKPQSSRGHSLLRAWEIPRLRTRQREREWEPRIGQDDAREALTEVWPAAAPGGPPSSFPNQNRTPDHSAEQKHKCD